MSFGKPEIVLRILGDPADAIEALKRAGAANSAFAREIDQQAEKTVAAYAKARRASEERLQAYKQLAAGAKRGSEEEIAALKLVEREQSRLAGRSKETAAAQAEGFHKVRSAVIAYGGAYLGGQGLLAITEAAAKGASSLVANVDESTTTFGKNGAGVQAWSKTMLQSFGLAEGTALGFANQIGRMLKGTELAPAKVAAFSKSIVELDSNMSALTHQDPGGFITAFDQAVAGRTKGLKQYAVYIDEASIKGEALHLNLVKADVDTQKLDLARDKIAISTAKLAKAEHDYAANSTQVHTAHDKLIRDEEALAKLLDGKVPKLTAAQRAEALYALTIKQTADAHDYYAKHAERADLVNRKLHEGMKQVEEIAGMALLPELKNLASGMADWLAKSENQAKVQHAVATAVHDVSTAIGIAVPLITTLWHDADKVAHALGGWKSTLELLLALKVASWLTGFGGGLTKLIGTETTGLAGAEARAVALRGALLRLGAIGVITIGIELLLNKKAVDTGVGNFLDKHGLGFLGGTKEAQAHVRNWTDWMKLPKWARDQFEAQGYNPYTLPGAPRGGIDTTLFGGTSSVFPGALGGDNPSRSGIVQKAVQLGVGSGGVYAKGGGHSGIAKPGTALDCSGYTYQVFTQNGFHGFPGTSETQWTTASGPGWVSEHINAGDAQPGDLVFMVGSSEYPPPGHVGIVVSGSGGNAQVMQYYHTGAPADTVPLNQISDLMGVKRFMLLKQSKGVGGTTKTKGGTPSAGGSVGGGGGGAGGGSSSLVVGSKAKKPAAAPLVSAAVSEAVAKAKAEVRGATSAFAKDKGLEDEIAALLSMRAALEAAEKGASPKRKEQIRKALDGVRSDLAAARAQLTKDLAKDVAASRKKDDLAHQIAQLLGLSGAELGAFGPEGQGGVEGVLRQRAISALKKQAADLRRTLKQVAAEVAKDHTKVASLSSLPDTMLIEGATDSLGRPLPPTTVAALKAKVAKLFAAVANAVTPAEKARAARALAAGIDEVMRMAAAGVSTAQTNFETAFGRVEDSILTAFDRVTQRTLSSMQEAFQEQLDALNREEQAKVAQMQKDLQARIAQVEAAGSAPTPTEALISQLQASHDAAQAAKELADAQKALQDAVASGDKQAIADAQASLDEIVFQQRMVDLQKQADAERKLRDEQTQQKVQEMQDAETQLEQSLQDQLDAKEKAMQKEEAAREQDYSDARDAQRQALADQLTDWEKHLEDGSASMADFLAWLKGEGLNGFLAGADLPADPVAAMAAAGDAQGSAFVQAFVAQLEIAAAALAAFLAGGDPASALPNTSYGSTGGTGHGIGHLLDDGVATGAAAVHPALRAALGAALVNGDVPGMGRRVFQPSDAMVAAIAAQQGASTVIIDMRGSTNLENNKVTARRIAAALEPHFGMTARVKVKRS